MRVAFVAADLVADSEARGLRRARRVAEGLAVRGHEVDVLCSQWWDGADVVHERADVTYRALTTGPAPVAFATKAALALTRLKPDVVHGADVRPLFVAAAKAGAFLSRAPMVQEWYGDRAVDEEGAWYRRALGLPDVVVTPSRTVKTWLRERGRDGDAVRVVPDGVDLDLVRRTEAIDGPEIVYSRRLLDEDANVETLLLALAELRDRDWSAAVVGEGPRRGAYEDQARDLRIQDRVTFVGARSLGERVAAYKGAHVFVQTARREPFAREFLWALAAGCVGIVEYHERSAAHELVEGRDRGFRVTTPQELADAIEAAGDLEELSLDESFAAYDARPVLESYLSCYRELMEQRGVL